jgi:hypothetical protein
MPENKILDPFKPAQPRIPGVSAPEEKAPESAEPEEAYVSPGFIAPTAGESNDNPPQLKLLWVGLALAGALTTAFLLFGLKQKAALPARPALIAEPAKSATPISESPADSRALDPKLPVGPGAIATKAQLSKLWAASRFYYRDPVTLKHLPAMVVHLPGGAFWGFSLVEPFGSCQLEYVTDLRKLQAAYGFEATYPMVADPCNGTVFDLTQYGNAPSGLVRGEIQKGPGWRPPTAIEIRVQGNQIIAGSMER